MIDFPKDSYFIRVGGQNIRDGQNTFYQSN